MSALAAWQIFQFNSWHQEINQFCCWWICIWKPTMVFRTQKQWNCPFVFISTLLWFLPFVCVCVWVRCFSQGNFHVRKKMSPHGFHSPVLYLRRTKMWFPASTQTFGTHVCVSSFRLCIENQNKHLSKNEDMWVIETFWLVFVISKACLRVKI